MEQQSDKLRTLLDNIKYDAPQELLPDLIAHIAEDDPYHFFRYVQDLLEARRLDTLLLTHEALWEHIRSMYVERFPWLRRRDLKYGAAVPERGRERNRRLAAALLKAYNKIPGNYYKEDWITEYLAQNGLDWDDVAVGRHLRMEIPGAGQMQMPNADTLRLDPRAGTMGLSRASMDHEDGNEGDNSDSGSEDEESESGHHPGEEDGDGEYEEPIAKMVQAPNTPDHSHEGSRILDEDDPGNKMAEQGGETSEGEGARLPPTPGSGAGSSRRTSAADSVLDLDQPQFGESRVPWVPPTTAPSGGAPPPKPSEVGDWLLSWLRSTGAGKAEDFEPHPYKGWVVSSPRVMLIRIANFLSDEDIDRTPEWSRKVAELTEYLAHLLLNFNGKENSWGYSLQEAISMLQTHAVFEEYHYGKPPLKLHFDEAARPRQRLRPVEGSSLVMRPRGRAQNNTAPRNLLHRLPQGAWDAGYDMPRKALQRFFMRELRKDEKKYWTETRADLPPNGRPAREWRDHENDFVDDRAITDEYPVGFNMCEVEDGTFVSCMRLGPLRTYEELHKSCAFRFRGEVVDAEKQPANRSAKNKQLLQFSRFRGANRAAVTFALRTLGSQTREIRAVSSPWRKLVIPRPDQRRRRKLGYPGIIWKPLQLESDQVPKDEFDPMAYNFWHNMLLENQGSWARAKIVEVEKAREMLVGRNKARYPPAPKRNFKGPYTAVEVNEERHVNEQFLKRLKKTWRDLETAARLSPREALTEVLTSIEWGRQLIPLAEEEGTFPFNVINHANKMAREVFPMKPDDRDLELLERMSHISVNKMMLKLVPKEWSARQRIFADRLHALVDDISPKSIFATVDAKATLEEVVGAINVNINGPVKRVAFTPQETFDYLQELEVFKRVRIIPTVDGAGQAGPPSYSRPTVDMHPEQTFLWAYDLRRQIPARPAPRYLTYEGLEKLGPEEKAKTLSRTIPLLKGTAWRLGKTMRLLEETLAQTVPTAAQRARLRSSYRDLTRNWEKKVDMQRDDKGARQALDYRDVIRYAQPARYRAEWANDDVPHDEGEILRAVFDNILRESHENKTMLWPARWHRARCPGMGRDKITWSRDAVWSWARPDVRRSKRYFHLNRWPVHLQTQKGREAIEKASREPMPNAVFGAGPKRGAVVTEEERLRGRLALMSKELEPLRQQGRPGFPIPEGEGGS
ncbi:uncharacterized protein DNG_04842 [Cephalotrichum gorgonifer]|uniref:Uncharacterized protein n=1 Tax=Cephalotrichum gorgonifer TaxID=2041049 RepID=A0AAE8MYV9_9PEZI|nr:uncharacterized protein DNG_04842 [Cephalotrichum gorgonifer]